MNLDSELSVKYLYFGYFAPIRLYTQSEHERKRMGAYEAEWVCSIEYHTGDRNMKIIVSAIVMAAILWVGLVSGIQGLAAVVGNPSGEVILDQSFDRLRRFTLHDAVIGSKEYYGFTETLEYEALVSQGLEIRPSNDPQFEYMAHSPYYKVHFKGEDSENGGWRGMD